MTENGLFISDLIKSMKPKMKALCWPVLTAVLIAAGRGNFVGPATPRRQMELLGRGLIAVNQGDVISAPGAEWAAMARTTIMATAPIGFWLVLLTLTVFGRVW